MQNMNTGYRPASEGIRLVTIESGDTLDLTVIIPFKDKAEMTLCCVRSLVLLGAPVREVLLVSNGSEAGELDLVRSGVAEWPQVRVVEYDAPFNFHVMNNWAARLTEGAVLFFLNNDTEFVGGSDGLLREMYARARGPEVGAVGCVLLYEDGRRIQHAGVHLVPGGMATHLYAGADFATVMAGGDTAAWPYSIAETREFSAVTAAAVMVRRECFEAVGGFNEAFIIGGGDVDLCLRLRDAGYATLMVGGRHGYILHKESVSRSHIMMPYSDFVNSYDIYIKHFSAEDGDPFIDVRRLPNAR
jgi:GT2 family glycosyltransferase